MFHGINKSLKQRLINFYYKKIPWHVNSFSESGDLCSDKVNKDWFTDNL